MNRSRKLLDEVSYRVGSVSVEGGIAGNTSLLAKIITASKDMKLCIVDFITVRRATHRNSSEGASSPTAVGDLDSLQRQIYEDNDAEGLPTRVYSTPNIETASLTSPASSDLRSNLAMSEVNSIDECTGRRVNFDKLLNFPIRPEFILPPYNLSSQTNDTSLNQNVPFNLVASPRVLDSPFGICDLVKPTKWCQVTPVGSSCFGSENGIPMWNQGLSSSNNNSITFGDAGNRIMQPDGGYRNTINGDGIEADNGTVNSSWPEQQARLYNPGLSSKNMMDYGFANLSGTYVDEDFSSAALLFPNGPSWDLENSGHKVERSSSFYPYSNGQPHLNTHQQPQKSLSALSNHGLHEGELDSLARCPKPKVTRKLLPLVPESTPSSLGVIAGGDNKPPISKSKQKLGCRDGPLDAEVRKGALKMRYVSACLTCKLKKIKCSGKRGEICRYCQIKKLHDRPGPRPCLRGPLPKLEDAFFPSFAFGHLELTATEDWMKESQAVAVGDEILIKFSSGPFFSSMAFVAREIWPLNPEFLELPDLSSDTHDRMQGYAFIPSLPYALSDYNIEQVSSECLRYINTISKCPIYLLKKLEENPSVIVCRSLEAVWRFLGMSSAARQNDLLYNVLKLYWTLYAIGRDVNLTVESVTIAIENLRNPSPLLPDQHEVSARFAARQIKTAMVLIYKDLLRKVLGGLETAYKSDTRLSAAIAFCVNIVLCFVVGELQTMFDGLIIYNISEEGKDATSETEKGVQCCRVVDEVLTFYSWTVFFNNGRRFNLLKDNCPKDDALDQDHGLAGLAEDFKNIMRDFEDEIIDLAAESGTGGSKTTLEHKQFGLRNSSKHICRYLKRFY